MTAALCTLCEERPATTSWGFPTCGECRTFLERLDVDLKAMEDADPELARIAGRFGKPYRERAREAIAARRKETALPEHPRRWVIGDRVRRHETQPTSDGNDAYPSGIVEATHYSRARPTVDVYWGTRSGGHGGDASVRVVTTEAPEALQIDNGPAPLQPADVQRRQAAESGVPFHEEAE